VSSSQKRAATRELQGRFGVSERRACAVLVVGCGHQRSPVILPAEYYDLWLDPEAKPPQLKKLLVPNPSDEVVSYPVNGQAKNPRNEGPSLIEPFDGNPA